MELKTFLLLLAVFVVTASAATVCKCGPEEKDAVSKYTVKVDDGGKQYDETVEVDTKEKTETFHIPSTGSSSAGEVDAIYDFEKNQAMHRISSLKACFLSDSTEDLPKPDELVKLLDKENSQRPSEAKRSSDYEYEVVGTVNDRSVLSDKMASLCAKLPIYRIKQKSLSLDVEKRVKRRGCVTVCYRRCWSWGCGNICVQYCN